MKILLTTAFLMTNIIGYSQTIEGDQLLGLVGKSIHDPLFLKLKEQETFFTDAWDKNLSIYIVRTPGDIISEVELQNGKLKTKTSTERYGRFTKSLPLQLNWNMSRADITGKLGNPTLTVASMDFSDYTRNGWTIRIFYESDKPVAVSYKKAAGQSVAVATNTTKPNTEFTSPSTSSILQAGAPLTMDESGNISVNWSVLKQLIVTAGKLNVLAGKDSVDYIGQVYYNTPWKVNGFTRTAIKRTKKTNYWHYESFYKAVLDSEQARKTFFSLYDNLKKTIRDNTSDDFILASSAKKHISEDPMNWMAQWTLYSNYKTLQPGLGKVTVVILLSGMKQFLHPEKMEYTFKFYVFDNGTNVDFWIWDGPK